MKIFVLFVSFMLGVFWFSTKVPIKLSNNINASNIKPDELYWLAHYYSTDASNPTLLTNEIKSVMQQLQIKQTRGANNWQIEGPNNIGGRVNTIAIKPNDSNVILIGTPAGGIFKTINGGANWSPVFDNMTTQTISNIVFDKNNPTIVYAGTGDGPLAGDSHVGNGIYKSTNAGFNWTYLGLKNVEVISKIIVDPNNSSHLIVSAMGNPFVKDKNRGVYESVDGGVNWNQILFIDSTVGVSDLVVNPLNSKTIFATGRHRSRSNLHSSVTGPKTKIYKTINGGSSWDTLTNGLPIGEQTKIGLAISNQDTNKLYANYIDENRSFGGVWQTINGGASWMQMCNGSALTMSDFGWYFGEIRVNPNNDNIIYVLSIDLWKSTNGGLTFTMNAPPWYTYDVHADKHDLQFVNGNTYYIASDGGVNKTTDGGLNWTDLNNFPITQFYKVSYNANDANNYYGGAQDNGTNVGDNLAVNNWQRIYGGDGFKCYFDTDPSIWWTETQNGYINVTVNGGGNYNSISSSIVNVDRTNWNTPYILDASTQYQMYAGTYKMYVNYFDQMDSWQAISGDLTDGPQSATDSAFHTITTICQNEFDANTLYVGTSDANIWVTLNGGTAWQQINTGLPSRYVTCVAASKSNNQTLYASFSGFRNNDSTSYLYKSTNNGSTWVSIANNLPALPINDIYIHPNTNDSNMVVATDGGVYVTTTAGASWMRLGDNMPFIQVADIEYNPTTKRLFAGTYARSIQSMSIDSVFKKDIPVVNVGIANEIKLNQFTVYPNPASTILNIDCNTITNRKFFIYNQMGKIIYSGYCNGKQAIDISNFSNGLYVVAFENESIHNAKPFAIIH